MAKYLDKTGVQLLWEKVKARSADTLTSAKNYVDALFTDGSAKKAIADQNGAVIHTTYIPNSLKGTANGIATLDNTGKVPSTQLPSYVDDVLEFTTKTGFPSSGESGKIYVAQDTNITYRWSGSSYVEISASLALGETSSTAYAGDKGKANATAIANLQAKFADYYSKTEADAKYQTKLVSGTSIKTVNGQSLLGSGNIAIEVENLDMSGYLTKTEASSTYIAKTDFEAITEAEIDTICV